MYSLFWISDFVIQAEGLQECKGACLGLPVLLTLGFGLASDALGGADTLQTQSLEGYLSPNPFLYFPSPQMQRPPSKMWRDGLN